MTLIAIPVGTLVAITKIRAAPNSLVAPGSWSNWVPGGRWNRGSLPVDYEIHGVLLDPIRVGDQLQVCRTWRNGVAEDGAFVSTTIQAIEGTELVITQNSVYRVVACGVRSIG